MAAAEEDEGRVKRWFPLESNPEVMSEYVARLGWPVDQFAFVDVLSIEEWALSEELVPRPVLATLLLFPVKEASEKHREEESARIAAEGQHVPARVYFTKQIVGNACGTIGLLHALANVSTLRGGPIEIDPSAFFARFITRTADMTPDERAVALQEDDEVEVAHGDAVLGGQSHVPSVEERINSHFIALVNIDGILVELDGRKETPIAHGPTTPETLLEDSVKVAQEFMARDPGELSFAMTALSKV